MKYTIENIIIRETQAEYIFFWGHAPSKDGTITKSCFSQWWPAPFTVNEIVYKTAEHWMMAKKAELFNDIDSFKKILISPSPAGAKKLGRMVQHYDDNIWLQHRDNIVVTGNYHKFNQNEALKKFLFDTGDRVIVEASPVDAIWGIGMAADDVEINNPIKWKGLNLLGFALMEVRDLLRKGQS